MSDWPWPTPRAADASVSPSRPAAPATTSSEAVAAEPPEDSGRLAIFLNIGDATPQEIEASSAAPVTEDAAAAESSDRDPWKALFAGVKQQTVPSFLLPSSSTEPASAGTEGVDPLSRWAFESELLRTSFEELRWNWYQAPPTAGPSSSFKGDNNVRFGATPNSAGVNGNGQDKTRFTYPMLGVHGTTRGNQFGEVAAPKSLFGESTAHGVPGGLFGFGLPLPVPSDRGLFGDVMPHDPFGPEFTQIRDTAAAVWGSAAPTPIQLPFGVGDAWSLPSRIMQVAELPSQDGCIWRVEGATLPPDACTPLVVVLGPMFRYMGQRGTMQETKLKYAHNLIRRAHRDVEQKLTAYLTHVGLMEDRIRQRYDPGEYEATRTELVETMVLDGLFIIEVLISYWTGKIDLDRGAAAPSLRRHESTPQNLRWEPNALRLDLIIVHNQIPFFVLEELFCMTDIPELREGQKQSTKLKQIILDYLVGDADDALAGYQGPVYHILHLVHLHLTFSNEQHRVSALHPNTVPRTLSVNRALDKLEQKAMDLRALFKRTFSRPSNLPVGWKQWKVIPPLRELLRVGVKLKRAETARFAQVKFKNGVLEIPPFAWPRYHIRLLTNLVVLEMSGWWPPDKRFFCSYVRFMAELIVKKEDAELLFKKGIVQEMNVDDTEKSLVSPFLILADYSHGSRYECRFDGLVRDMVKCYKSWSRVGAVRRSGR